MVTREEIKKFISQYLRGQFASDDFPEDECDLEAEFIFRYLHSQGVVIKMDKPITDTTEEVAIAIVEPLIKE